MSYWEELGWTSEFSQRSQVRFTNLPNSQSQQGSRAEILLLNSSSAGIFNPLINISCALPSPVSIAAAKFTFNQDGAATANFHVTSCNLLPSVNSFHPPCWKLLWCGM